MKVLVIGGAGFVGSHVVRRLVERGHVVTVLHRGRREADLPPAVHRIQADVNALPDTHNIEADVVIHGYALTHEDAQNAVRLFRGRTGKLVVLSSGDVYRAYGVLRGLETGAIDPLPITEDSRLRGTLYPYRGVDMGSAMNREVADEYEKILVERASLNASDLPACVLRLPVVYGPGDRHHRFLGWVKRMDDNRPAILMGESMAAWRWTHGYVENVAEAIAVAAIDSRTAKRIFNIGESAVPTMSERAAQLAKVHGWNGHIRVIPDHRLPQHLRIPLNFKQGMAVDTSRFRSALDFENPVPDELALTRTIEWERAVPVDEVPMFAFDYDAEDAVIPA